jgi:pimeloyl-ACP methyl ester carboxylesterase
LRINPFTTVRSAVPLPCVYLACLFAFCGCVPEKPGSATADGLRVYIGPNERAFHESDCPLVEEATVAYTRDEAELAGYEPCEICHFAVPPEEVGKTVKKDARYGKYVQYVPTNLKSPTRLLVIAHGTPGGPDKTALGAATVFIRRWIDAAEEHGVILVSPAFDQPNFGGIAGPGGGYRGMWGREVNADVFVNTIVHKYTVAYPSYDGRFYLFGHSAGGQFASRYLVTHPDRVVGAVITAAGTFAYPDPDRGWTAGMGRYRRAELWGRAVDYQPDPAGWLKAATLPVTAIVGALDDAAHTGGAANWVEQMNAYAEQHGKTGRVKLRLVPKIGHNSRKLTPAAIAAMFGEEAH